MSEDSDGQRPCRRGVNVHELDAAMALADMAGVGPDQQQQQQPQPPPAVPQAEREDEELASTRLSLELGKVGIQSSPCSSSSSAGHHHPAPQQQPPLMPAAAAVSGYGPRPRHMLTEAEKEAKRLRRVLANRESARQTILRRQAIRDELARKVADLSSQNESMKKEKDMVMREYLSLKEANKQLKEQADLSLSVARTTKKAPAAATVPVSTGAQVAAPPTQQEAAIAASSPPTTPPQPSFLYTAAPPAVPVPYVWGSWPPTAGYEHAAGTGSPPAPAPPCLPPCAWYYPVVADPRGSPSTYPLVQDPRAAAAEPTRGGASPAGAGTAEEDTDDDPCSLTLALDVDKRSAPIAIGSCGGGSRAATEAAGGEKEKAATAAEARKRRKELTKLKHMHAAGRPGGEQW